MGRQTRFHMLPDDCQRLVQFLQARDPVVVAAWHSSETAELQPAVEPWKHGDTYCLWNQAVLPILQREITGKYFNVDFAAPVIQLSYSPSIEPWNGQPALIQGRIWSSFETSDKAFQRWYDATVRWILKNFIRDVALGHDRDSVGPAAYDWFRAGGLLLPNFRPPPRPVWLDWVKAQNEHRGVLGSS